MIKRIEVFGFSREQILEYIDNFPFDCGTNCADPAKLKDYLRSHPNVFDMCYLPVHAAMICFLYKHEKGNIPCIRYYAILDVTTMIFNSDP